MREFYSTEERADLDAQYAGWKDSAASDLMMMHAKVKTAVKGALRNHHNPM
jgi:hypothetical protein